jgi:hypothetical protein
MRTGPEEHDTGVATRRFARDAGVPAKLAMTPGRT